jgi:hypothetical protein
MAGSVPASSVQRTQPRRETSDVRDVLREASGMS